MNCPQFQVVHYGIYDSRVAAPKEKVSPVRQVKRYELELITENLSGVCHIDNEQYSIKQGLLICSKPGQQRYSQFPLKCHYVHLQTDDTAMIRLLHQLPDACYLPSIAELQESFHQLIALPQTNEPESLFLIHGIVSGLIAQILRQTAAQLRTDRFLSHRHRAIMSETDSYIRNHLSEPLTLDLLAQRVQFSPSHFHRIFTSYFGKTPHAYILSSRIASAQAALRADWCELIDVATACGFSSQAHFSAQFKKATGLTPLQYRRQMLSGLSHNF